MWRKVIIAKYGRMACGKVALGEDSIPWFSSIWWRDICSIGTNLEIDWFSQNAVKKIGNGGHTSFWSDKWLGDFSLCERFPRLFSISNQRDATMAAM
jgi:hypothetical protein